MNQQPVETRVSNSDGQHLDVHSIFYTLQGEGPFSGQRATFIRLAGCNLQCPGCDTEYTSGRERYSIDAIMMQVVLAGKGKGSLVVITGGEPLRQPIGWLVDILLMTGRSVQIESNGTLPPDKVLDQLLARRPDVLCLVVSPKTKSIQPVCYVKAAAFKYVLDATQVDEADGLPTFALSHIKGRGVLGRDPAPRSTLAPWTRGR